MIKLRIKSDSRKINKGDIFVDFEDNEEYVLDAINRGAKKVIVKDKFYDVETQIVNDPKQYIADYLYQKYQKNFKKTTMIGITGTNGKTTTAYLTYQLLNKLGIKCAYIGTIGFYINNKHTNINNTTPDILDLYELFIKCFKAKVKVIVMEVSSHALKLNRVLNIKYDYAIFTNLTHDHMDFHKNIGNYKDAKKRLFNNLKNKKIAILNIDDPYYKDFIFNKNKNITYGKNGDINILKYELFINKSILTFIYKNKTYQVTLNIPGLYNIYNYLAVFSTLVNMKINPERIIKNTKFLKPPKGRMESISNKYHVFIDYAHTPDAVLNVLNNVKKYNMKIITIIGCGGDRDKLKRPIMGEIATENSDHVIFTNDNPRNEDEKKIMKDIVYNIHNSNYEIIYDREEAIKKGISMLTPSDILLILGKGHETYQLINGVKHDFDDHLIACKYLNMK